MFRKIMHSKYTLFVLNAVGIFSLASFILLWTYLRFIVDLLPACYFTDALIVYVECGKGLFGGSLGAYFQFFSPLVTWIIPLLAYGLAMSLAHLEVKAFLISLIYLAVLSFILIASCRLVWRTLKRLVLKRAEYSQKERISALVLTFIILLPTIITTGLRYHLNPPSFFNKMITVNMWHDQMQFPRSHLEDWSLVDIDKPAKSNTKPNFEYTSRWRKEDPFIKLYLSFHEIDKSLSEKDKFFIDVFPKAMTQSEEELFQTREDYLEEIKAKTYRKKNEGFKVEHTLYSPAEQDKIWEVYKSAIDATGYDPDIYVYRNKQSKIENILRCVPRNHCAVKKENTWSMPKCKSEEECLNCTRMCQEASFGTTEYVIHYSFDKKYLDTYLDRHQKILEFIESHSVPVP